MKLTIVSLNKEIYQGDVTAVFAKSPQGAFEIRPGHAHFLAELVESDLYYETDEHVREGLFINGGVLEARPDEDFLIVARTDARACQGLDDALERIGAYARCGADVGFVEAPQSVEELKRIPLETPIPQMANMLLGGVTPILNWRELEQMGFKWVVSPVETLAVCMSAMQAMMTTFLQEGSLEDFMQGKATLGDLKDLLALERWQPGASVDKASDTGPHTLLP